MKRVKKCVVLWMTVTTMISVIYASAVYAKENGMLQFTAGEHVLGFGKTGMYSATGSHALRIGFGGTKGVMPEAGGSPASNSEKAMPLQEVKYPDLWDGITLAYTCAEGGILESTYYVQPYANVKEIRLVYNVPVEKAETGP